MIRYVNSETGELLGTYPPSRGKNIYLVVTPEAYKYLVRLKESMLKKEAANDKTTCVQNRI